jgi:general secretion pathway protein G
VKRPCQHPLRPRESADPLLQRPRGAGAPAGYTLIELSIVLAIVGVLAAIGGSTYVAYLERARVAAAVSDIANLSRAIDALVADGMTPFPASLDELRDVGIRLDPWGNPYQYLRFREPAGSGPGKSGGKPDYGKARKDRFLVPINSEYDLYSMGADGKTQTPLTAKDSQDDVIRANDGSYIGLAEYY